ncbi:MAG: hypothetical protein N4A70_06630 [Pelagimonas sp.]|jgi:hypothetical protein|nr:hypothetical protein [Pelagimonas sp.]
MRTQFQNATHRRVEVADVTGRTLAAVFKIVEEDFNVDLTHGYDWGWDSAHVELADWKAVKRRVGRREPTSEELDARFAEVLSQRWKQYQRAQMEKGRSA